MTKTRFWWIETLTNDKIIPTTMLGNLMNIFFDGTLEESSERQVRETTPDVTEKVVQSPNQSLKSIRKMLKLYERGMERILKLVSALK